MQVLRYCFEDEATPLCPSNSNIPTAATIPCCENCGGLRKFEFQIMPQLINSLNVDAADPRAPDWGAIAIYSCAASCDVRNSKEQKQSIDDCPPNEAFPPCAYLEEFVWVQPPA